MNRDEAQELLSQIRSLDQWRRHDAPSNYDPNSQASMAAVYPKFSHVAQQISFPPVSPSYYYTSNKLIIEKFYELLTNFLVSDFIAE